MPPVSNAVAEATDLLRDRLRELDGERAKVERALASLTEGKRGPGRPRGSAASSKGGPKRRSRRGGTRAEHAIKLIRERPGISASEIAKELRIKPNYMYRVLSDLIKDGKVRKDGRTYHVA
ncbi:MAG: winged helix-turn-helix transcriptional regulator [Actinomycetota bacterium]|nr:winged helix-turn-helix transcriptional regulator [Actinomycetota bacterium]